MKQLFLDTGHSTKYQGASGFKLETVWVRAVATALLPLIKKENCSVVQVPDHYLNDTSANSNLIHRIEFINSHAKEGDLVLSLHGDSATSTTVRGVTTCYLGGLPGDNPSVTSYCSKEALKLSQEYQQATGVPLFGSGTSADGSSRFGRLGIIRDTKPFALLLEMGFVSNKDDMSVDANKAAQGVANFINNFFSMGTEQQPEQINVNGKFTPEQIDALQEDIKLKFTSIAEPAVLLEEGNRIDSIVARYRERKWLRSQLAKHNIILD